MVFRIVAVVMLVFASLAQAGEQTADALRLRVEELRTQEVRNQERILELGGSNVSSEAKRTIAEDIRILQDKADRLHDIVDDLTKTRKELQELEQRTADGADLTIATAVGLAAAVARNKIIKKTLEQSSNKVWAKSFFGASLAGAALGYGGAKLYRNLNARKIRKMVEAEQVRVHDVLELVSILRETRNLRGEQLEEVRQLEKDQEKILEEVAELNKELDEAAEAEAEEKEKAEEARKPATQRDAMLERDMDAEGDAAEQRQANFDNATRLCDPSLGSRKGNVGSAGTLAPHENEATGPCRVIDGEWLLEYVKSGRRVPVTLGRVGREDPPRYGLTAKHGLNVRCSASGYNLTCEMKMPPPQTCPSAPWEEWQKGWTMTVATVGIEITGRWEILKVVMNPTDKPCYLTKPPVPFFLDFRLVPTPGGAAKPG